MVWMQAVLAALLGLAWMTVAVVPARAAAERAAIFHFELDDTSLEGSVNGVRADETARLQRLDTQLRDMLVGSGRYEAVDTAEVLQETHFRDVHSCNGCDAALARQLGAGVSIVGWVQKVSNLILNINLEVRSAADGHVLRAGSVDIRGNTDESWSRGLAYLLKHRILSEASPPTGPATQ